MCYHRNCFWFLASLLAAIGLERTVSATDYVLTIGGGYEPAGNQASLEANVLFFQQVVKERFSSKAQNHVYFADGVDAQEDLQVMLPKPAAASPAIALLESVFALDKPKLIYRNHEVPNVRGPISPKSIRSGLDEIRERLAEGDRLIVYVTAHGGPASSKDSMNTSITCWHKQPISMKTFAGWLDQLPSNIPVVLVMAQCYCGGFANTIFEGGEPGNGLASAVRVGFFAQRFDLPAAGCRPDIENDEEYSSYFWGSFVGRSRTGKQAEGVDCDQDGRVSLAEAHAFAVRASQTIDIPLKSSDILLRHYSRIGGYESTRIKDSPSSDERTDRELGLEYFTGSLQDVANLGTPAERITLESLAKQLELSMTLSVTEVFQQNLAQGQVFQESRLGPRRRGPGGPVGGQSGRGGRNARMRTLQKEIVESWPDLSDPDQWQDLDWLHGSEGESILGELKQLPSFEAYSKSQADRQTSKDKAAAAEARDVRFKRLVHAMESIVLAINLPRMATPEVVNRFQAMLALESTHLGP
ncbi:MAG: hypothetical protein NTY15_11825 [Planctomycetota bacterium]|nr:hypothetical protein [Planctomycetota bacterium]